jgi:demethylmenaquinone methyltransferase/2-methoxy-6-polyprenyl-1,4-benzoquinol methylase
LCCGTGDIASALAARGAETTGLDFSPQMLEVAAQRQRNSKSQISNLKFIQGDAQQLPFAENSFNIVTVGYGLRNLTSWERGLDEMHRVAKPGARLIVLDFGKPANPLWRAIYFTHLKMSVPLIGLLFCGNASAYAYILESLKHYPAQLAVADKMRQLKLTNVRIINLLGGAMAINYGEKTA